MSCLTSSHQAAFQHSPNSTADFTWVIPVFSPPCPEKMVQGTYLCTRTYDIEASFELIFRKFVCLMRVHPRVNPIVFVNNRPNRTIVKGENVPSKPVFGFHSAGMEFFMKKNYKQYLVPHLPQKRFDSFLSSNAYLASKMVMPPKLFFEVILENMLFFSF